MDVCAKQKGQRTGVSPALVSYHLIGSLGGGNERADVGAGPGRFSPPSSNVLTMMGGHAMLLMAVRMMGCGDVQ